MVNGMTVNGLGEVSAMNDVSGASNANSSLLGLGKQLTHYLILGTHFANSFLRAPPTFFFSFLTFHLPLRSLKKLCVVKKKSW